MGFAGEFHNTLDAKGRSSIPARLREVLGQEFGDERLVITKNTHEGLSAYPLSRWEQLRAEFRAAPPSPTKEAINRLIIAPATEVAFDGQGRIAIPPALRAYADLDKNLVMLGGEDKIEIYSEARYAEVCRKSLELLRDTPQALSDLGF